MKAIKAASFTLNRNYLEGCIRIVRYQHRLAAMTWGAGDCGALGHGDSRSLSSPKEISYNDVINGDVLAITCGAAHTITLIHDKQQQQQQRVFVNGLSGQSRLLGVTCDDDDDDVVSVPYDVSWLRGKHIIPASISAGRAHSSIAVVDDVRNGDELMTAAAIPASLHLFGSNNYGQLGLPASPDSLTAPYSHGNMSTTTWNDGIAQVCCGLDHTLVLTCKGDVFSAGWAADGQIGRLPVPKDDAHYANFNLVEGVSDVIAMSCRADTSLVLTSTGEVWGWGNAEHGQTCTGERAPSVSVPRRIPIDDDIVSIASGGPFSLLLTRDGRVLACGFGYLGTKDASNAGYADNHVDLRPVIFPEYTGPISSVSAGTDHALAISEDGVVWTWGCQRGTGIDGSSTPIKVPLPDNCKATALACGSTHSAIIVSIAALHFAVNDFPPETCLKRGYFQKMTDCDHYTTYAHLVGMEINDQVKKTLPAGSRVLGVDDFATMDFIEDRLNVFIDESNKCTRIDIG